MLSPSSATDSATRRGLPEDASISVLVAPLAVLAAVVAFEHSPWVAAGAVVLPAPLLGWLLGGQTSRPHVVGSYLLAVASTAFAFVSGALSGHSPVFGIPMPLLAGPVMAGFVAFWSQLLARSGGRRWSAIMGAGLIGLGGLMLFSLAAVKQATEGLSPPEKVVTIAPCKKKCTPRISPTGHATCASYTQAERMVASWECTATSSSLTVNGESQQTTVFVAPDAPVTIWRERGGHLVVEQGGSLMRVVSPTGAILAGEKVDWSGSVPPYALHIAGASMLLVGLALAAVLRSLRAQRLLAAGLAGHVEAGRFFPRDGQLAPLSVEGAHTNGPALLFGVARRASYRDGGGTPVRVVFGTMRELISAHHVRRFWACAFALAVVLFAIVSLSPALAVTR